MIKILHRKNVLTALLWTSLAGSVTNSTLLRFAYAQTSGDPVRVLLNGRLLRFDVAPQEVNGRVMVPLRGVFEALGATVDFDPATRAIYATRDATRIRLRIGSTQANVNGATKILDIPPRIHLGRTLVPLRFISESLGAIVDWDAAESTVYIKNASADTTPLPPVDNSSEPPSVFPPDTTSDTDITVEGTVLRLEAGQRTFDMRVADGSELTVRLDTALPDQLSVEDRVKITGRMRGSVLLADARSILFLDDKTKLVFSGIVMSISNRRLIVENDEGVRYTVQSTFVPSDLTVGDTVKVSGHWTGTTVENSRIVLIQKRNSRRGQTVNFSGTVERVSASAGTLQVRGDNGQLYSVDFITAGAFRRGDQVRVVGRYSNGRTTATSVIRR